MKKQLIIANCRINRPDVLPSLRDIATNHTAYDILLIFDCKLGFYDEILKRLMKLCVDRDLNCGRYLVLPS